ncbi:Serine/threonine protein kinase [Mycena chlorophos]|uniref:Serine/threonine protein kinase n=1 Tax=Mycena chlorophos TaxID=658473 RepID=A0A8H6T636_MYCCL|nr:Serine/threonine protein kinase [Mycena chlorophos]
MTLASTRIASRSDASSLFFTTLCAAFEHPQPSRRRIPQETQQTIPLELPVDWSKPEHPASSSPRRTKSLPKNFPRATLAKPIYTPPKEWEWTTGLPFQDTEPRIPLSSGAMCDVFVRTGLLGHEPLQYISKQWLTSTRWHGFFSELALYKVQLKSLQGRVVPTLINVYAAVGAIDVAMKLPHASFWIEASADMPNVLKKRCVQAYEQLHTAGVLHGDVELRHMLIGGDARVTLIDFQESKALAPNPAVQLAAASPEELRFEMRKVKYRLDYEGARELEHQRVLRAKRSSRRAEDVRDPPVGLAEWESDWHASRPDPRRFVVPGQSTEDLERAIEHFLDIVDKLERDGDPDDEPQSVPSRKRSPEFKRPALPRKPANSSGRKVPPPVSPRPPKRKADCDEENQSKRARKLSPPPPPPQPSPPNKRKREPEPDVYLDWDEPHPPKRLALEVTSTVVAQSLPSDIPAPPPPVVVQPKSPLTPVQVPRSIMFRWIGKLWKVMS